jgi:hypothetical protein
MPLATIDFEKKHHHLCDELREIRIKSPLGDRFHQIVEEMRRNVRVWLKLGMPDGPVQVQSSVLEEKV